MKSAMRMNESEAAAWRALVELGARVYLDLIPPRLDVTPVRVTSARKMRQFASALVDVAGRSGANRRHVDRSGAPVYVVTDDAERARAISARVAANTRGRWRGAD